MSGPGVGSGDISRIELKINHRFAALVAIGIDAYIAGLSDFRHLGPPNDQLRSEGVNGWLRTFAAAARRACDEAESHAREIDEMVDGWRARLGSVRRGSSTQLLLDVLPGAPIVTVETAARLVQR